MQPAGFQLNPVFSFTLAGTFAIYLWTRPPRSVWPWVLPIAAVMRWACGLAMGGLGNYPGIRWISWGTFLGLATLLILLAQTALTKSSQQRDSVRTFYACSVFPLLAMLAGLYVPINVRLSPKTLDSFLLAFDGSLRFQPSFVLGRITSRNHQIWAWAATAYFALPLEVSVLYASYRTRVRHTVALLGLLLSFTLIGVALYLVYPAVGPRHAFADIYPWRTPRTDELLLGPMAAGQDFRNCMPSLHFGTALLVWWNSRIWPTWGRTIALIFLVVTTFSTLSLGEHYLVDLIVAIPFSLAFQAAWTKVGAKAAKLRRTAVLTGSAFTAMWLILLRYAVRLFERSTVGGWAAVLTTVALCFVLETKLASAANMSNNRMVGVRVPVVSD